MKLTEQCQLCRSYTWCGRPCRNAPRKLEAAKASVASRRKTGIKVPKMAVYDRATFQREYLREYMRKRRAKAKPTCP